MKWTTLIQSTQTWLGRLERRINPIALLETRQVLSMTRTLIIYGLLVLGLSMGTFYAIDQDAKALPFLLLGAYTVIAVLLVPSQVLFNSSARWAKDKLEMLHLTRMRPIDIVLGRVLSGAGLLIMMGAIILPFVSLCYLMPGTEISLVLLGMSGTFMMGLLVILLTLNISWRLEEYSFATIGKVFWFFMLMQGTFGMVGMNFVLLEEMSTSEFEELMTVAPWIVLGWVSVAYFGIVQSISLFRHVESNRSTPYRIGIVLMTISVLGGADMYLSGKEMVGVLIVSLYVVALMFLPMMVEPDRIGRNVFAHLHKKRWVRIVSFPFLPSAGTGVVLLAMMLGAINVWVWFEMPASDIDKLIGFGPYVTLQLFALTTLLLPRVRHVAWMDTLARRNSVVAAYLPLLATPFLLMAFLMRSDEPLEWMGTYIFPFGFAYNFPIEKGNVPLSMVVWSGGLSMLSLIFNLPMIRQSWKTLVNLEHPDFENSEPASSIVAGASEETKEGESGDSGHDHEAV